MEKLDSDDVHLSLEVLGLLADHEVDVRVSRFVESGSKQTLRVGLG